MVDKLFEIKSTMHKEFWSKKLKDGKNVVFADDMSRQFQGLYDQHVNGVVADLQTHFDADMPASIGGPSVHFRKAFLTMLGDNDEAINGAVEKLEALYEDVMTAPEGSGAMSDADLTQNIKKIVYEAEPLYKEKIKEAVEKLQEQFEEMKKTTPIVKSATSLGIENMPEPITPASPLLDEAFGGNEAALIGVALSQQRVEQLGIPVALPPLPEPVAMLPDEVGVGAFDVEQFASVPDVSLPSWGDVVFEVPKEFDPLAAQEAVKETAQKVTEATQGTHPIAGVSPDLPSAVEVPQECAALLAPEAIKQTVQNATEATQGAHPMLRNILVGTAITATLAIGGYMAYRATRGGEEETKKADERPGTRVYQREPVVSPERAGQAVGA